MKLIKYARIPHGIFNLPLNEHEKFVLIVLTRYGNNNRSIYPTIDTISNSCSISRRTTINALKSLEDKGYLSTSKHYQQATRYVLSPALFEYK